MDPREAGIAAEGEPRWLDPLESRAWRGWLAASELLRAQIGRDLVAGAGLSEADFVVLVSLSEHACRRIRMSDLAATLRWSKSRLSHQVARMEQRGLVVREGCASDARGSFAALTDRGLAEIESAAPGHVESVREHFIDLLTPEQTATLAELTETVIEHLLSQPGAPPRPAACPNAPAAACPNAPTPACPDAPSAAKVDGGRGNVDPAGPEEGKLVG